MAIVYWLPFAVVQGNPNVAIAENTIRNNLEVTFVIGLCDPRLNYILFYNFVSSPSCPHKLFPRQQVGPCTLHTVSSQAYNKGVCYRHCHQIVVSRKVIYFIEPYWLLQ